jgi:pimeloyl-ACP methyl ester carboxylesterase
VSTPRTLRLGDGMRRITLETSRGMFAALEALPATGVCERQPALLVPGYTGSKEDFIPVLGPLASAGRRVVAIDMRGQYESAAAESPAGYRLPALAADLAVIADGLAGHGGPPARAGRRIHLLGHSFGGLAARELALGNTAITGSLTLMSSGPGTLTGPRALTLEWLLEGLRALPGEQLPGEIRRLWETQLEPQAIAEGTDPEVIAFLRTRMLRNCPAGLREMAGVLLDCPDRTAELAAAPAPMLVVYGENDDAWAPAIQEDMARRLGAHRVCIPGAAHSPAVEAPETVASTLTAFWNAAETSRAHTTAPATVPRRA